MSKTLQKMTYGHYILTALKDGDELKTRENDYMVAGIFNWATQVSFEPEMIAIAVGQKSDLNETIDYSKHFTLHLLNENHKEMIEKFSDDSTISNGEVNGVNYKKEDDEMILADAMGFISCEVEQSMNVGDHTLYIGKVVKKELSSDDTPLCTNHLKRQYSKENAEI